MISFPISTDSSVHDTIFLERCLTLAKQGRGKTGINPMVGAVLVRDEKIIAEGFHSEFGNDHAEQDLLKKTEYKICSTDILYVNLEPCCHTNKKTPPCAQMLTERGIKNVVIGMKDPNPAVAGKGIELLRSGGANVRIVTGLTADCLRLNLGFVSLMEKSRPWITVKSATTADGKHSKKDGSPLKITLPEQDKWSHEFLRARHDAILVGVGTVLKDDPLLTVRFGQAAVEPWRIILDPSLKTLLQAKVLGKKAIIITQPDHLAKDLEPFKKLGVRVLEVPFKGKIFDWSVLWKELTKPTSDFYGISSILVEGGPTTWEIFRKAGMVDEEVTLVGDPDANLEKKQK